MGYEAIKLIVTITLILILGIRISFELARSQKKTPWEIEQSGAPSPKQVLEFYCYIQKKAEEEKEKEKEDTK